MPIATAVGQTAFVTNGLVFAKTAIEQLAHISELPEDQQMDVLIDILKWCVVTRLLTHVSRVSQNKALQEQQNKNLPVESYQKTGTGLKPNVLTPNNEAHYINGHTKQSILDARAKGVYYEPVEYLSDSYRATHLKQFYGEASYLMTGEAYNAFVKGKTTVGRADGQFISTAKEIDAVLAKANGDISIIESELGIEAGDWQNKGGIYRVDVYNPEKLNLRMAKGNETGANKLWEPGGYTSGGKAEAVVDPIPSGSFKDYNVIK